MRNLILLLISVLLLACEWMPEQVEVFQTSRFQTVTLAVGDTAQIALSGGGFSAPEISDPAVVELLNPGTGLYSLIGLSEGQADIVFKYKSTDQNSEAVPAIVYLKAIITNGTPLTLYIGKSVKLDLGEYLESTVLSQIDSISSSIANETKLTLDHDPNLWQLVLEGLEPGDSDLILSYYSESGEVLGSLLFECHIRIQKIVLAELFTNSGCVNCPQANGYLDNILEDRQETLALVRYHVNWTDPRDPMNLYNPTEVMDRVLYYGIFTAPSFILEGEQVGTLDETDWISRVDAALQTDTPVYISPVTVITTADSLFLSYELESYAREMGSLLAWSLILEDSVYFEGSNGEDVHRQVMRDMTVTQVSGMFDQLELEQSLKKPEAFDSGTEMTLIIFLQDPATRQVIQTRKQANL